jgi:hypothetical protein
MIPMIRHLTALPKASLLSNSSLSLRSFSPVKEIKKVEIVGLGLMGYGVAQVSAQAGDGIVVIKSHSNAELLDSATFSPLFVIRRIFRRASGSLFPGFSENTDQKLSCGFLPS